MFNHMWHECMNMFDVNIQRTYVSLNRDQSVSTQNFIPTKTTRCCTVFENIYLFCANYCMNTQRERKRFRIFNFSYANLPKGIFQNRVNRRLRPEKITMVWSGTNAALQFLATDLIHRVAPNPLQWIVNCSDARACECPPFGALEQMTEKCCRWL